MNRDQLIGQKHAVQQQLNQARRRLEAARTTWDQQMGSAPAEAADEAQNGWLGLLGRWVLRGIRGPRSQQARIAQLQHEVDSLMAEEYRLRCAIDRSGY